MEKRKAPKTRWFHQRTALLIAVATAILLLVTPSGIAISLMAPVTGAIFTTDGACAGTNVNIFNNKNAVYLDGGPAHPNAAGLPDGAYYVQVTEPNGTLLGTSVPNTAVVVIN